MTPRIHLYFNKRKCCKSDENFFAAFKQKFTQTKCHKNSLIIMSWESSAIPGGGGEAGGYR